MASSSALQIAYAQMDQQSSEYSPPEAGLVVPIFQKGNDPIDAINHMMSFLTNCTKPRRKRDAEWFKDKVLLVQAQANGQVLQEEEIEFLADLEESRNINRELALEKEVKELSEYLKEKESFEKKISILKDDLQKEESRNIDRELALEKEAQKLKPNLYDGSIIGKSDVSVVPDSENTLLHAEES
nr:hypothetical protein [Tanacetum cinerariifolium]